MAKEKAPRLSAQFDELDDLVGVANDKYAVYQDLVAKTDDAKADFEAASAAVQAAKATLQEKLTGVFPTPPPSPSADAGRVR